MDSNRANGDENRYGAGRAGREGGPGGRAGREGLSEAGPGYRTPQETAVASLKHREGCVFLKTFTTAPK